MPVYYDPKTANPEAHARWDHDLKPGKYVAKLVDVQYPAVFGKKGEGREDHSVIKCSFVVVAPSTYAPQGAVKLDFNLAQDWRSESFLKAFGFPTNEPYDMVELAKRCKFKKCGATVNYYNDRPQIKKLIPVSDDCVGGSDESVFAPSGNNNQLPQSASVSETHEPAVTADDIPF